MKNQTDETHNPEEKRDYQRYRPQFALTDHPPQHEPVPPAAGQDDYFLRQARQSFPYLQALRRHFHSNPELPMEEKETSLYIREELRRLEIPYQLVDPYGVVAVIHGCGPGRTAALRADMDALPVQELAEPEYRSRRDSCMHACGHDAHTAMLLGAARLLAQNRDRFSGTVKLVFQEAEEIGAGALLMLESGVLDDCGAIFGLHQSAEYPTGQIFVPEKSMSAANVIFTVKLKGRGSHGSMPHQSADPVVAAAALVQALQPIVSRELDPAESAVLTVGYIKCDTCRCNIIPEQTEIGGTIRYYTPALRQTIEDAFRRTVRGISQALRVEADIFYVNACIPVYNDPALARFAASSAAGLSPELCVSDRFKTAAAEDFAFYQQKLPGVFLFVGSGSQTCCQPLHSPYYDIDEQSLSVGCALYCKLAVDYLNGSVGLPSS